MVSVEAFSPPLPGREGLPRYVAPLPGWLEDLGLRLAYPIAAANLLGTLFGFYYYRFQLQDTPLAAWAFVPDSPLATLFVGLSLLAYARGFDADGVELLHTLAFFGCLKLGLWTPFVQLVLNGQGDLAAWLYWFLVVSHLGMAAEAFLVHRYSDFPVWAVAAAAAWYGLNDLLDYFLTALDGPHHTWVRAEAAATGFDHASAAHDLAAACAVALTLLATFLALATRVEKLED